MKRLFFYGTSNFVSILLCIIFVVVGVRKYGGDDKKRAQPLKLMYICMIALEFIKIFYHIAVRGIYEPARYPIVFCSLVMFFYPIICHCRNKTLVNASCAITIVPSIVLAIIYTVYIPPLTDFTWYDYAMNMHSRIYHYAMLAAALYILITRIYTFEFKDFYSVGLIAGGYFAFATALSLMIGGNISYFGPTSQPMNIIYDSFGYVVGNCLLIITVLALSLFIYSAIWLIRKAFAKKKQDTLQKSI